MTDEAGIAAAKAPQQPQRRLELETSILTQRAADFFDAGRYVETLLALDQRAQIAPERQDLMVLRGYAYLELGRKDDARRVFKALKAAGNSEGIRGLVNVDPPRDNGR